MKALLPLMVILIQANSTSANHHQGEGKFHQLLIVYNVSQYDHFGKLFKRLTRMHQAPDCQDKIGLMKECLIENLHIHLADADAQLEQVFQL